MSTYLQFLWKEWRDHRRTVYAFWILLLVGTAIVSFAVPDGFLESGALSSGVLSGSMMLAVAAVCTELIPGEVKRNTVAFLARTPHGLHMAFWAKATVVVVSIGVFAGSAWIVSSLFRVAALPPALYTHVTVMDSSMTHFAVGLLVLALWCLAMSCWTPIGLLAVPAVGFLVLPYYFWIQAGPHMLRVFSWQSHVYLQATVALAVAWSSFVWGRRFGRHGLAAAWRGITLTVAGSVPFWICLLVWHTDYYTVDPQKGLWIVDGYLGSGGRLAFLTTLRRENYPALTVVADLQTGQWRQLSNRHSGFVPQCVLDIHSPASFGMHDLVLHHQGGIGGYDLLDGRTGDKVGHALNESWPPKLRKRGRAAKQRRTTLRMPDGRRVWMFDRRIEVETEDGGFTALPWDPRDAPHAVIGYGFCVPHGMGFHTYDWRRGRLYTDRLFRGSCWVLADHWLIAESDYLSPGRYVPRWSLYDPDTGKEHPLPWIKPCYRVIALLEGNRVLVDATNLEPQILVIDFGSEEICHLKLPARLQSPRQGCRWTITTHRVDNLMRAPMVSRKGRRLFALRGQQQFHSGEQRGFLTLAPGGRELTPVIPAMAALAFLDDETLVVIGPNEDKIEAVNVLTGERKTLFPR